MEQQDIPVKKKRGRKPKNSVENTNNINSEVPAAPKKRGRKPKGGKLINKISDYSEKPLEINNVILHLKCSINDIITNPFNTTSNISYNPNIPPPIESFNIENNYASYNNINNEEIESNPNNFFNENKNNNENVNNNIELENDNKSLNQKLKILKMQLYKEQNNDKKSACFWCTYDFDNTPCYIPAQDNNYEIYGYGSFCRPECAAAYLMKENLDDSIKFERYHFLNKYYGKIYNFDKSIKPAPDPHFTLDRFYGNLNIKEYRKLLKSEHMLITLDKPFSKSLPELHEENDVLVSDIYGCGNPNKNSMGMYKVKRESEKQKGPTKTSIIKEKFGLT